MFMFTIVKRSGRKEMFQATKIENSMKKAGVSVGISKLATSCISYRYHQNITTLEVRLHVVSWIRNLEPQAARQYELFTKKAHKGRINAVKDRSELICEDC